ncbi:MAG: 4-hydroxy-tetrahydrodipicolinate reductase [Pirellulaceae bacterium]|jgi:4-hydroxy-tetrahydrodipicolinate reductase
MTRIAIHGAAGRMGQRLVALGSQDNDLQVVATLEYAQHPRLGMDAGSVAGVDEIGTLLTATLDVDVEAMIDFSVPAGAEAAIDLCAERGIPLVMATTGLTAEQENKIRAAAEKIPVVWAPNMSTAVNLTMKLATMAAATLKGVGGGVDVEIIDRHHRYKEDSPSGTALKFGQLIADAMGQTEHVHGREGITGQRSQNEIGYHALRVGDNPGEHTIVFSMLGETVELIVRASNRDCYAQGALTAAKFVAGKPAGLYNMYDVLNL